jgi:hypothetical protein
MTLEYIYTLLRKYLNPNSINCGQLENSILTDYYKKQ